MKSDSLTVDIHLHRDNSKQLHRSWRWARDLGILALLLLALHWWQTRTAASGAAPPLAGQLLSGELVSLADYRGQPLLVHFWATWCPICRLEQDAIDALARDHVVLTVATNSGTAAELLSYVQNQGLDFPVLLDEAGDLARLWRVEGVPASFIIDPDGQIAYVSVGYTTGLGLRARLWLAGR